MIRFWVTLLWHLKFLSVLSIFDGLNFRRNKICFKLPNLYNSLSSKFSVGLKFFQTSKEIHTKGSNREVIFEIFIIFCVPI